MSSAREAYLNTQWPKYPVRPKHHNLIGRIIALESDQAVLQLRPGESAQVVVSAEWANRLAVGDWISSDGKSEICLLAPNRVGAFSSVGADQLLILQEWNRYLDLIRQFFRRENFFEAQTPTLVVCPGTEPFLDVFSTEFVQGRKRQRFYLPTSPELSLKKLLAQGLPKIFEMRPCFRNGEVSATHRPEFWMLEWYRQGEGLEQIKIDVENLVEYLSTEMGRGAAPAFRSTSMAELFQDRCGFELQPQTTAQELAQLASAQGLSGVSATDDFDDLFFHIFLEKIERDLVNEGALFVEKYPPSQAALARLTNDGWGDRFEFYWQGLEIANAFHELNDPEVQRQRFAEDLAKKAHLGKPAVPLDEEFLRALDSGLPPSAGIALGLERLFMALMGLHDIGHLRLES